MTDRQTTGRQVDKRDRHTRTDRHIQTHTHTQGKRNVQTQTYTAASWTLADRHANDKAAGNGGGE